MWATYRRLFSHAETTRYRLHALASEMAVRVRVAGRSAVGAFPSRVRSELIRDEFRIGAVWVLICMRVPRPASCEKIRCRVCL